MNDVFEALVHLTYFTNPTRQKVLKFRPGSQIRELFDLHKKLGDNGKLRMDVSHFSLKNGSERGGEEYSVSSDLAPLQLIGTTDFLSIPLYKDVSFLRQKYEAEGLSIRQIAKITFSSRSTILKHLKKAGLSLRNASAPHQNRNPGQVPYGKKLIKGRLVDYQSEQNVISQMRRLRGQGLSYQKIAELLNLWEIKTKNRKSKWQAATVKKILDK